MPDLDELREGDRLLIHARLESKAEDRAQVVVEGPRPPFTKFRLEVGPSDIHSVLEPEDEPEPIGLHDIVRNQFGKIFEVVSTAYEDEDGRIQVAIHNKETGIETDYVSNLEIIQRDPTQPSALRSGED